MKLFSLYDSVAEIYTKPFFIKSTPEAIREFTSEANNPQSKLYQHAQDFTVYEIGEYDEHTGEIQTCIPMKKICSVNELKKVQSIDDLKKEK
mgnify:CR=1 FL=1